jgi:DNA polymerase III subunit delta
MITLIHGPAELLRAETLAELAAAAAPDPEWADLNTAHLDGRTVTPAELQNACDTMPFLAEKRLVIVEGLLARLASTGKRAKAPVAVAAMEGGDEGADGGAPSEESASPEALKGQAKAFLAYLDHVPDTADLVLVEDDTASGQGARRVQELARGNRARIILCEKPRKNELPDWIRSRARLRKVKLDAGAVNDLAEFVGDELRQLDQELVKLADFAGERTVTREDVRRLVAATRAASVFELVDSLGLGDAPSAGRLMQHSLDIDGEQPLRLLGMIARQYRLIIQMKALQAQGKKPPEIAHTLNVGEWNIPKLTTQANRHTFGRLERAMERILAADEAIKTGRLGDREAMDILLAELLTGA